jgi:hypothetical protein
VQEEQYEATVSIDMTDKESVKLRPETPSAAEAIILLSEL